MSKETYEPIAINDFILWKESSVTQAFLIDILNLLGMITADLVTTAGKDSREDSYKAGRIRGLTELADWKPITITSEEITNEI